MSLHKRIALVAGATRGAGRGIATALGEAGATVYCTGRSTRKNPGERPETIEETAERVSAAGGQGVAVAVDHSDEAQVQALAARIREEQGGLDLLVNDVWGGDAAVQWGTPLHELDVAQGKRMFDQAIWTHILTTRHLSPLMFHRPGALVVEITDGDSFAYRGNLFYDLVKHTVQRLAFSTARELRPFGVSAVAVTPGFLRSEAMLEHFGVSEANWRDGAEKDPNFIASESPLFVGRAIAALAADAASHPARNGRVFSSWGLARDYGLRDADGSQPHWGEHWLRTYGRLYAIADKAAYAYWENGPMEIAFPPEPSAG